MTTIEATAILDSPTVQCDVGCEDDCQECGRVCGGCDWDPSQDFTGRQWCYCYDGEALETVQKLAKVERFDLERFIRLANCYVEQVIIDHISPTGQWVENGSGAEHDIETIPDFAARSLVKALQEERERGESRRPWATFDQPLYICSLCADGMATERADGGVKVCERCLPIANGVHDASYELDTLSMDEAEKNEHFSQAVLTCVARRLEGQGADDIQLSE